MKISGGGHTRNPIATRIKGVNGGGLGIPCGRTKMLLSDRSSFVTLKGRRRRGRLRFSWRRTDEMEGEKERKSFREMRVLPQNRVCWRSFVEAAGISISFNDLSSILITRSHALRFMLLVGIHFIAFSLTP